MPQANKTKKIKEKQTLLVNIHRSLSSFYISYNEKLYRLNLQIHDLTASEAIIQAINKLNEKYNLNLKRDPSLYELYGAKKNGMKKEDLPSIESHQILEQTNLKRFYIMILYIQESSRNLKNSSFLQSEMNSMAVKKKKEEVDLIKKKGFFSCLCVGS